ncbi:MAG: pseudoazurin [Pseudomonadota bacterium]
MSVKITRRHATLMMGTAAIAAPLMSTTAVAMDEPKTIEVLMLNQHPDDPKLRQVFVPRVISANPGDTIKFVAADKSHNAATSRGMIPEGAAGFKGKINQDVEYVAEGPGIYGVECTPHKTTGMVALVVVEGEGKLANLEEAKGVRHPGKARQAWEEIWAEAEEMGLLSESTES